MGRVVAAIVTGLISWLVVVTLLNFGLRMAIPGYHAAEATLQFTTVMKIGRLVEAGVTSIAAGALVSWIAPSKSWAPWVVGLIILAMFLPLHLGIWTKLPVWYHLAFLVPLVPLVAFGGSIIRKGRGEPSIAS